MKDLKKKFSEDLSQIERNTFEVQEEIMGLQMLPMEIILGSIEKMVEETAMKLDKEINYQATGTEVLLDKRILEGLKDPLIHIIRNSIDHGIENPEARIKLGKKPEGKLELHCTHESNGIVVTVKDDGKGLNYDKIRSHAIEMNPHMEEEITKMDHSHLNHYLFESGFSTKEKVTELSGRGVGLDIVKYNIEKIKGKISIKSEKNKGTEFTFTLPLSLATVEGFFVMTANEKFLIPSTFVREISLVEEKDFIQLHNRIAMKLRDELIPLYYLSDIMDKESYHLSETNYIIIVESFGETVGIIVDLIIRYSSLIYKAVPNNVSSLKAIQGIVFDESFNIINILYIPEVINRFKSIRNITSKKKYSSDSREYKSVLVVDDSFTTREIEKSILEVENYNVETAVDGIDGIEKLNQKHFNLIITDIKMPRMDGLTFVENIRRDERFKEIPIIVVSSEKENEIKETFFSLGANAFIVKSDFDRGNLIDEVKKLIG